VLTEAAPDAPAWSWTRDRTAGFWVRRMVHETIIHRADLQLVDHLVDPSGPELAADGIDELLSTYFIGRKLWQRLPTPSSTAIRATDTGDEWFVAIGPEGVDIRRGAQVADVAVAGAAWDLELMLWGRTDASGLLVEGDEQLLDAWLDISY